MFFIFRSCLCQINETSSIDYNELTKYTLDTYDKNNKATRYHLNYDFQNHLFKEYSDYKLAFLPNVQYAIICHENDIDKNDNEKKTMIFWNIATYEIFIATSIYLNAFPVWYIEQKKNGNTFCMRFDSVGWYNNGRADICKNETLPCPDLIILNTSQVTYRYFNDDTLNLNKYFRKYNKKYGKSFESLLNKYSYYEYRIDNNWLAVPISEDFRIFQFNLTTFNECKSKGYDLHYPPPLSNYWGTNYKETWTWKKAFEYAEMITKCTKKPGLQILNNYNEDLNFFSTLCHSLNIPFITEDVKSNIKKCGLRKPFAIEKLSILKNLTENHYIEMWLNKTEVEEWQKSPYPESVDKQPIITYDKNYVSNVPQVNGMFYNTLFETYVPGSTSILLGTGIIITKKSRFPDEAFEFIEVLINEKYPFYTELNISKSPIENIYGKKCIKNYETFKKNNCSSLIQSDGIYPYYYINNNKTNIIYLTHKNIGSKRGISVNVDTSNSSIFGNIFVNKDFICDKQANFEENTITYQNDYKLVIPLSNNRTVSLKSTIDININLDQTIEMICSFEQIVNECCDIIDNALIPYCQNNNNIKFSFTECFSNNLTMSIKYLNCKTKDDDEIPRYINCNYIPYSNNKGYILIIFSTISSFINMIFLSILLL
ncbi:hypothetical protein U3516DRAFT_793587 [Neocallimastix sp. 'constans']